MKLENLLDDLLMVRLAVENENWIDAENLLHEMIEETKWKILKNSFQI